MNEKNPSSRRLLDLIVCLTLGSVKDLSHDDVRALADAYFTRALDSAFVPGAVVVDVQDTEAVFMRGYGYASLEKKIAVDPERTLFRVGSISKLFTAVAVMQLHEQDRVDLKLDVNAYLTDFEVPSSGDGPVTLANLLTHTAGIEDAFWGFVGTLP